MRTLKIQIIALLLCLIPITAVSADYNSAMRSYERGKYNNAVDDFRTLAKQNDPYAQFMLGKMFAKGQGVKRDYVKAYKWLTLADYRGINAAGNLRDKIARQMSRTQLSQAKRLVNEWRGDKRYGNNNHEISDRRTVRDVQMKLKKLGYFNSSINGALGWSTVKAIRAYQHDNWLKVDGKITTILLRSFDHRQYYGKDRMTNRFLIDNRDDNRYDNRHYNRYNYLVK